MSDTSVIVRCKNCLTLNRVLQSRLRSKPVCGNCKTVIEVPQEPLWAKAESFDREVAYWPETLLIMFTAPMCLHCKILDPLVRDLALKRAGRLKVMQVDVETDEYLAQRFAVTKTPTFIVYRNAVEVIRVDGAPRDKTDLVTWIDNLMGFTNY
jgi:thioredoxin 2